MVLFICLRVQLFSKVAGVWNLFNQCLIFRYLALELVKLAPKLLYLASELITVTDEPRSVPIILVNAVYNN